MMIEKCPICGRMPRLFRGKRWHRVVCGAWHRRRKKPRRAQWLAGPVRKSRIMAVIGWNMRARRLEKRLAFMKKCDDIIRFAKKTLTELDHIRKDCEESIRRQQAERAACRETSA